MDRTKVCIAKRITYVGLFVLILVGYAAFSFFMLQKKQVTNSRAEEMVAPTLYTAPRGSYVPLPYLYKGGTDTNALPDIQDITFFGGIHSLQFDLTSSALNAIRSVSIPSSFCVVVSTDKDSGSEEYLAQIPCINLHESKNEIDNVTTYNPQKQGLGIFVVPTTATP